MVTAFQLFSVIFPLSEASPRQHTLSDLEFFGLGGSHLALASVVMVAITFFVPALSAAFSFLPQRLGSSDQRTHSE
jgi:hypothetical protein